jgi:hypothetical protein
MGSLYREDGGQASRRWIVLLTLVVVIVLSGAYLYASPYLTVSKVRRAAQAGDAETVGEHVDFPALRESLKGSFGAFMAKQMAKDDTMRSNPFAALGAGLAMMVADKMVDLMITPEGVQAMIEGQRPQPQRSSPAATRESQQSDPVMRYETFDRFTVTFRNNDRPQDQFTLVWRRSGLTWKLSSVRLPMPEASAAAPRTAAPTYSGDVQDAKTAEGKSIVSALWTSVQASAVASCGQAVAVSTGSRGRASRATGGRVRRPPDGGSPTARATR